MIPFDADELVELECRRLGVSPLRVKGPCRDRQWTGYRKHIAKVLDGAGFTYMDIARALGRKDHTSVIYWLGEEGHMPKREAMRRQFIGGNGLGL